MGQGEKKGSVHTQHIVDKLVKEWRNKSKKRV